MFIIPERGKIAFLSKTDNDDDVVSFRRPPGTLIYSAITNSRYTMTPIGQRAPRNNVLCRKIASKKVADGFLYFLLRNTFLLSVVWIGCFIDNRVAINCIAFLNTYLLDSSFQCNRNRTHQLYLIRWRLLTIFYDRLNI